MLAGHCDQIGLVVQHIDNEGFLRVSAVGGWDVQTLIGQAVEVHGAHETVHGVIARKAIHLLTPEERKQVPEVKDLWVDLGVAGKAEALELVAVGDPVTLRLGYRPLRGGLLAGPAMDDRVGVWVVVEAARRAAARQSAGDGPGAANLCGLHGAGGDRPAGGENRGPPDRPARGRGGGRDARLRLPDGGEGGGRRRAGRPRAPSPFAGRTSTPRCSAR